MIVYERVEFHRMPPEAYRLEWCRWLERHGIDPSDVPVPCWIERRPKDYQVAVQVYARNKQGHLYPNPERTAVVTETRVVQLEGPPLPFPKIPADAGVSATIDMVNQ